VLCIEKVCKLLPFSSYFAATTTSWMSAVMIVEAGFCSCVINLHLEQVMITSSGSVQEVVVYARPC